MRSAAILAITALSLGLATAVPAVAKSAPQPPNNAGSTSILVRYAYFTSVELFPTELRRVTDFPAAFKDFEAAKESAVVFVGAIDSPGKDFTVSAVLKGPDGSREELFSETKKYSPDVRWHPVRRVIAMDRLRPATGGKWSLELQIDGQPAGTYGFEVAPDLVRAEKEKAAKDKQIVLDKPAPVTPPPPSGPSVQPMLPNFRERFGGIKVEFAGPPRLRFRVDGKEHVLDDKGRADVSLSAAEHEIEVKGGGFKPLKEKLKLSSDKKVVQHKLAPEDAVPPTIAVLEPKPEAGPVLTEDVRLRLEIKGEARLSAIRILNGGRVVDRLTPDPKLKPGEAVVLQPVVRLAEGDNQITIEAEDENEKPAKRTVDIERERLIAIELRSEPSAKLVVNKKEFSADRSGTLALRLLPGEYEIEASKPGFKSTTERITLVRGQRSIQRQVVMVAKVGPSIALLDPAPGADPVLGDEAKVKIEIKGDSRLTTLRIVRDGRVIERVTPDSRYRPGQPWVVESTVRGLAEGDNSFTLEAEDDTGRPGKRTMVVARERMIAVELSGEPSAKVSVNKKEFSLGPTGSLTLRLLPGDYQIEATKPGFKPLNEKLTVKRGQPSISQPLAFKRPDPPSIALIDPKEGAEVNAPLLDIKIEVRSTERVTALKVSGLQEVTARPKPNALRGEPWVADALVKLALGPNDITLEAVDEHGQKATKTVKLVYVPQVAKAEEKPASAPPRPIVARPQPDVDVQKPAVPQIDFGRYHALVIGNWKYDNFKSLKTPERDARAVAAILKQDYGFDNNVRTLINGTRDEILRAFEELRRSLHDRDNLLVYYAGHGVVDEEAERGYWLPVNAEPESRAQWLSNADVTDMLKAIKAKHVLIVADSCYSGTLTRDIRIVPLDARNIDKLAQAKARTVLTSGGREPVSDSGGGANSIFAKAFLDVLRKNTGVADLTRLFPEIKEKVLLNSDQEPVYSNIRQAGHEGGDFIFVRRGDSGATRNSP